MTLTETTICWLMKKGATRHVKRHFDSPKPSSSQGLCPLDPHWGTAPGPQWGPTQPPHPRREGQVTELPAVFGFFTFYAQL